MNKEKHIPTYKKEADIKRLKFITSTLISNYPEGARVLDVGCGNGIISNALGDLNYNVLGIDISEKAIKKAHENKTSKKVIFKIQSADDLLATNDKFDVIICSEVLEHLDTPENLIRTLHQCCKNDGIIIVTVPNGKGPRESFVTKPILKLKKRNDWKWNTLLKIKEIMGYTGSTVQSDADNLEHIHFFTKDKLMILAKNYGFKIIKFKHSNFIDDVFPFSLLGNRIRALQKFDCKLADYLPHYLVGGFNTVWKKE